MNNISDFLAELESDLEKDHYQPTKISRLVTATRVMLHQLEGFRDGLWSGEIRRQANLTLREVEQILNDRAVETTSPVSDTEDIEALIKALGTTPFKNTRNT